MSQSPIGALMVTAEKHSRKKPNGHTETAPCGCQVTVARFGASSQRISPERCSEHPLTGQPVPSGRGPRRGKVVEV